MNSTTTSTNLRGLIATAIFGAVALSFSAFSAAADSNPARTAVVKFADLNLSTPEGADALYHRIRRAAKEVCSPSTAAFYLAMTVVSACIHRAVTKAVIKVNKPALFDAYNAKNRPPLPIALTAEQAR